MKNKVFISELFLICLISSTALNCAGAGNCGYSKTRSQEYRKPLKNYLKIYNSPDSLLSAAEKEFRVFDSICSNIDEKDSCENLRCRFRENLINELIKKAQKSEKRIHQIRSNNLLANVQMNYYRRTLALKRNGSMEQMMAFRIKALCKCGTYLGKASDYLQANFEKYQDSLSVGLFCDAAIKRADLILFIGFILASSPAPESDPFERNLYYEEAVTPELAIERAIELLTRMLFDFKRYKELNIEGFNKIDQKIAELNSLLNDPEKQKEIGRKALNP